MALASRKPRISTSRTRPSACADGTVMLPPALTSKSPDSVMARSSESKAAFAVTSFLSCDAWIRPSATTCLTQVTR